MSEIVFLFPGQGSQSIGMGQDLYQEYSLVRELFDMAEEICRIQLTKLCFKGPMSDLTMTVNLQPAITVVNLACLACILRESVYPAISAGHSLGEYSALRAAAVISEEDTLRLVFRRGELMHREACLHEGAMHAVIGLDIETVQELVATVQSAGVVSVANHNTSQQIVTTGEPGPVARVSELAKERGGKAIPLRVSGAWHSALIQGAEADFHASLAEINFNKPQSPLLHNVTADSTSDPAQIRELMAQQLCSPVRWYDSMQRLHQEGHRVFAEIGPGRVLTGMLHKILPADADVEIYNVFDLPSLETFLQAVT